SGVPVSSTEELRWREAPRDVHLDLTVEIGPSVAYGLVNAEAMRILLSATRPRGQIAGVVVPLRQISWCIEALLLRDRLCHGVNQRIAKAGKRTWSGEDHAS